MSGLGLDLPKIKVEIRISSSTQDKLSESDLDAGKFDAILTANAAQRDALKTYVKEIQLGTDTTSVETAINAL